MQGSNDRHAADQAGSGSSRRKFLAGAGALGLGTLGLAACGGEGSKATATGGTPAAGKGAGKPRKVIWALAAIAPWNLQLDVGFIEATRLLGWEYQKAGVPIDQYSPESVVNVVNRAVSARPDVLVTPAWVPGLAPVVKKAQDAGILVMFNNANNIPDVSAKLQIAYIGADDYGGGKALAPVVYEAMRKNGKRDGVVLGGLGYPGNDNIEKRLKGAADGLAELNRQNGTNFRYERFIDGSAKGNGPAQIAYTAKIRQVGQENLAGIFTVQDVAGPLASLRRAGAKPGEIVVGAWDLVESTLNGIRQGWVVGTVDAGGYQQGFLPVMFAWEALERGQAPRDFDSGKLIVTRETIDAKDRSEALLRQKAKDYGVKLT
jgi:ABC-type sugar transport system substrate-binding protein